MQECVATAGTVRMFEVDLAEAFQAGATRIARASCSRLFVYREALAAPVPSRTVAGESSIDLRETAIDIGRIEVEAVQDLISVMVRGATSILQRGGVPKQNRSSDEAMETSIFLPSTNIVLILRRSSLKFRLTASHTARAIEPFQIPPLAKDCLQLRAKSRHRQLAAKRQL